MGKYKFRFSDMIPNAWFHKLKDMSSSSSSSSKPRSKTLNPTNNNKHYSLPSYIDHNLTSKNSDQRKSYYISRDLDSPPPPRRRSTKRNNRPRPPTPPQLLSTCSCRATVESVSPPSPEESGPDQSSSSEPDSVITEYGSGRGSAADSMVSWSSPCKCGNKNDIIIDIDINNTAEAGEDHCRRRLAPIITKNSDALSIKVVKEDHTMARRMPARSPGMRLRVNSPRIGNRRIHGGRKSVSSSRRSISDSLAVVKASKDPRRDFRESMVEMIMENNIKASKDLEELLTCYLSLNSEEYHDLIINVFKQIWFDIFHLRLN